MAAALEERARARSGPAARPPTSSAPRCATCWPGCARWPTRATRARSCARSSRPPIELRSVDVARLTQLARRRKLDMPSAVAAGARGPAALARRAATGRARSCGSTARPRRAFEDRRPDAFVMRLIERIGLRRQQVFATQRRHRRAAAQHRQAARAGHRLHAPRAAGHARASSPATWPRWPSRGCARRRPSSSRPTPAVPVMTMHAAKGLEFDHVFVLGLSARRACPGPWRERRPADVPGRAAARSALRRTSRARPRGGDAAPAARGDDARAQGAGARLGARPGRPAPRRARRRSTRRRAPRSGSRRRSSRRSCSARPRGFTRPSGSCATSCSTRSPRVGGRLGEMRLDTYLDVDQAVARYLELIKVAALIERAREGQPLDDRAARGQRDPRPVRHPRAARDLRGRRRSTAGCATPAATRPSCPGVDERLRRRRSTRSSRAAAAG